jgi:cytochrome b
MHRYKIWDLPTRVFHWLLAAAVCAAIITAKVGGTAMDWHVRWGILVLSLLAFRVLWGFLGGHWSRFRHWPLAWPALKRYFAGQATTEDVTGHTPTGSWAVVAMLLILLAQVGTGLIADDEIAISGPLAGAVSASTSSLATSYHHGWGQWLLLFVIALHLGAIVFYVLVKKQRLVRPMLNGDKLLDRPVTLSRDGPATRVLALVLWLACLALTAWQLG